MGTPFAGVGEIGTPLAGVGEIGTPLAGVGAVATPLGGVVDTTGTPLGGVWMRGFSGVGAGAGLGFASFAAAAPSGGIVSARPSCDSSGLGEADLAAALTPAPGG